jgi:hypothetical protein
MANPVPHGDRHPEDDAWCSVNEAARRLEVTPTAIRNRIKRGTLKTKPNGNIGHLVYVPRPVTPTVTLPAPGTVSPTVMEPVTPTVPEPPAADPQAVVDALNAHLDTLKAMVVRAESTVEVERTRADRERDRAAELMARVESLLAERSCLEVEAARARGVADDVAELRALVERMRRPWWKRLVG